MTDPTIPEPSRTPPTTPEPPLTIPESSPTIPEPVEGSSAVETPSRPPKNFIQQIAGQWPLASVLAGVAAGLGIVATGHWRMGTTLIGAAITLGGLLRLLPHQRVGLLAVRNKALDTVVLLTLGIGIVILAFWVPPSRG